MEEWKELVYKEINLGYKMEISNFGRLRNTKSKKIYSQEKNKKGYMCHCTSLGSRNSKKVIRIHVAVALMFVENKENKPLVNHKDGIKTNNIATNLEWVTNAENIQHAWSNGLVDRKNHENNSKKQAKLTDEEAIFILENYKPRSSDYGVRVFSRKYNISHTNILGLIHKYAYLWIDRSNINNPHIIK